jgi:putative heme-binding domain-containing protein
VVSLRQKLESFHGVVDPGALDFLWPHLGHGDRAVRGAARVALEWQPVGEWKSRALQETRPRIALLAMLALARSTDGQVGVQAELLEALEKIDFGALGADEQAWHLRIITVSAIRHGLYVPEVAARLVAGYEAHWPTRDRRVNEEIVAMSAALGSTSFSAVAIGLLEASLTQEEQVHYTRSLLSPPAVAALTPELRNRFFKAAVQQVPRWIGGSSVKPLRESVLRSLTEMLTEDERRQYADLIAAAGEPASAGPVVARSFVKAWKTGDFTPAMEAALKGDRDLANGRRLYAATGCLACHNFRGEGGLAGPDLSSAGGRYSARDLLENILEPSKVINEQYSLKVFTQKDGSEIVGRLVNMSANELILATNPMDPGGSEVRLRPDDVTRIAASPVSLMPPGLVNTLNESELLDLLAYLTQPVVPLSR